MNQAPYRLGAWLDLSSWGVVWESSSSEREMGKIRVQDGATQEEKLCSETHQKDHLGKKKKKRPFGVTGDEATRNKGAIRRVGNTWGRGP